MLVSSCGTGACTSGPPQAFPDSGHPGALVYLPSFFNVTSARNGEPVHTNVSDNMSVRALSGPLHVVVYFHGFYNCIENIVRPPSNATNCTPGAPTRCDRATPSNHVSNGLLCYTQKCVRAD